MDEEFDRLLLFSQLLTHLKVSGGERMGGIGGPSATSLMRKARGTAVCKPAGEQYSGHMVTELEVGPGKDSPFLCLFHEEK